MVKQVTNSRKDPELSLLPRVEVRAKSTDLEVVQAFGECLELDKPQENCFHRLNRNKQKMKIAESIVAID